ncbi:hypothetical protein ABIC88_003682 [Pseudomonas kilonensis]
MRKGGPALITVCHVVTSRLKGRVAFMGW